MKWLELSGHGQPGLLDLLPAIRVGFVCLEYRGRAKADTPAIELDFGVRLAPCELGLDHLDRLAYEAIGGEVHQHREAPAFLSGRIRPPELLAQLLDRRSREEFGVTLVDRLDRVFAVEAGVVPVVRPRKVGEKRLRRAPVGGKLHRLPC